MPDFGWRLRGQAVGVLPDRSFDLAGRANPSELYCATTLRACLQCGACTAACSLAGDDGLFPRRQVTFVRLGLEERAALEPDVWHCYGCAECAIGCPSGAQPQRLLAALRAMAVERFARPRALAGLASRPLALAAACAAAAAVLAGLVALAGAFAPPPGPIRYADLLPDRVLVPLFTFLTVLALVAATLGAARAWRTWQGASLLEARRRVLAHALARAVREILAHRKLAACGAHRWRAWAHRGVLFGVLGLGALSAVLALRAVLGSPYPLANGDPLKLLGNVAAALLLGGLVAYAAGHVAEARRGDAAASFDWLLSAGLLLVATTGVAAEALRAGDVRAAAFPVYFVHLVFVAVLLAGLPYTKLAHAFYRLLAVAADEYEALLAEEQARPLRVLPPVGAVEAPPAPDGPEAYLDLDRAALAACSDAELVEAYGALRDEVEEQDGRRRHPNVRRLFATAFEREKDRREVRALVHAPDRPEAQAWYEEAAEQPCTWWLEHHLLARRALSSCMACGMCTSVCPAAEHYEEYDPRLVVDVALSGDEGRIVDLLRSDVLWLCSQCGSCTGCCPRENDVMTLVSSLRVLAQLKGHHVASRRGAQQYAGRHLWGGNLWNRGVSLYFRNPDPDDWPDFGPRYARAFARQDERYARLGASPDEEGLYAARAVDPETLAELRACIRAGGTLFLWDRIEEHAAARAAELGLDVDDYLARVRTEG